MSDTFPTPDMELTHLLVVSDMERSLPWYRDVLGAEVSYEYGGTSAVLKFLGNWLLLVTPGGPTPDKPTVSMNPPADPDTVSGEMIMRVQDCYKSYEVLKGRGAEFLTPPEDRGGEVRAFFRDPDGHLFEISSRY